MPAASADKRRERPVKYTYEPTGSGDGKAKVLAGLAHFAGSDSALSAKEQLAAPNAWFVPLAAATGHANPIAEFLRVATRPHDYAAWCRHNAFHIHAYPWRKLAARVGLSERGVA